jgi:tight adherence protein B
VKLLLALVFAAGVGLLWFGVVVGVELPQPSHRLVRLRALLEDSGLDIPPYVFVVVVVAGGLAAGLVAWWLVRLPAAAFAGVVGGGVAPVAWARSRRERRFRERERAWPPVLSQLADALEAGLAWPAAVAQVARSGPVALQGEWAAFAMRLRGTDLATALEGLRSSAQERTADSVAMLLRAALVELPTGGLAPVLRELSTVLSERLEAREKARSRASTMHIEAAAVGLSPIVILLLIGAVSPGYLAAYRGVAGTIVLSIGGGLIWCCYLMMRRLGRVPEPRRTGERS